MAIVFVGRFGTFFAGRTDPLTLTLNLTEGIASTPAAGDFVLVSYVVASTVQRTLSIQNTSAVNYTLVTTAWADDVYDANMRVAYRFMPGTPETQFVVSATGSSNDAGRVMVHVFRGVDPSNPLDVAAVVATGTNGRVVNPGAITPSTAGSILYVAGGSAAATGGLYTASYLSNFLSATQADVNSVSAAGGWREWSSGAYDPAAFGGGGTSTADDSWVAVTLALRPEGAGSITLSIDNAFQAQTSSHISGFGQLTAFSWDTERRRSGKQPWQFVEVEVDRCTLTYGVAPCTAAVGVTGAAKCFNGWENCQDPINFTAAPFFFRFSEQLSKVPSVFPFSDDGLANFLPLVQDIKHEPGLPNPGESLGSRTKLSVNLQDAPHHDIGVDKYLADRPYDPMRQGSFLRKLKTRWPHYIGRRLRWYQGYLTPVPTLTDFQKREYIIESVTGPDVAGRVTVVAKDVLKLLDGERAQAPRKSRGKLQAALDATTSYTQIDIATPEPTEYNLNVGQTVDYIRISKEIFTYTGTASITGGVRLTGVTRAAPVPYTTTKATHDVEDEVQRCRYFQGTIPSVVYELMTVYGDVDPLFINKPEWDSEAEIWLAGDDISRLVTEPEKVKDLINEIIEQTLTWGFWYDEVEQKIKFRSIHPADVKDVVIRLDDSTNIVADSIKVTDTADKIVNEVQILYGQIDPAGSRDDVTNYRRGEVVIDADSQGPNEIGQRRIKRIFANWHKPANGAVVLRHATRTLQARIKNLFLIEFKLERKDENVRTSQFADLTTLYLIDEFGIPRQTRVQVLRADAQGEAMTFRAREDFFKGAFQGAFPRWAPENMSGLTYDGSGESIPALREASADVPFSSQSGYTVQTINTFTAAALVPESGIHGPALPNGDTLRFGKVNDPTDSQLKALAVQVHKNDPTTSGGKRTEMRFSNVVANNQFYWVTVSVYVYDWGTLATNDNALFGIQLHNGNDALGLSPAFGIYTRQAGRHFSITTVHSTSPNPSQSNSVNTVYAEQPLPFEQWMDFVFRFKINTTGNGVLQVWKDDVLIVDRQNQSLGFNTPTFQDYIKSGYYNWTPNNMNNVQRKVLIRSPRLIADPTNSYTFEQINAVGDAAVKATYMFWADSNGKLGAANDEGKTWS